MTPSEDLPELSIELAMPSDRACAVVAAAIFETLLEQLLRASLLPGIDALFAAYGPLSSLAGKIDVSRGLALISESEASDLHRIRRIRNEFAHSIGALAFHDSPIRDHIAQLRFLSSAIVGTPFPPRREFVDCVAMLSGFLKGRIGEARRPADLPDYAAQVRGNPNRSQTHERRGDSDPVDSR